MPEKWNDIPAIDTLFKKAIEYSFTELKPFSDTDFLKELHQVLRLKEAMDAGEGERRTVSGAHNYYTIKDKLGEWFKENKIKKPKKYRNVEKKITPERTLIILSVCVWKMMMKKGIINEDLGQVI